MVVVVSEWPKAGISRRATVPVAPLTEMSARVARLASALPWRESPPLGRRGPSYVLIVGFRPSPGRVPDNDGSWSPLSTSGPMARTVEDVALFLSAIAGVHAPDPTSLSDDPALFRRPLAASMKGKRIAWFTTMGGLPFEPEITRVLNANRQAFIDMGCIVEDADPDFSGVDDAFPTLRHLTYHTSYATLSRDNPTLFKDTVK